MSSRQAKTQLLSEKIPAAQVPTLKELELARRRHQSKKKGGRPDFQLDCAASWESFVQAKLRRNQDEVAAYEFKYIRLVADAPFIPLQMLANAASHTPCEGSTMMCSDNMLAMAKQLVDHNGLRGSGQVQLCMDCTYKISCSGLETWKLFPCRCPFPQHFQIWQIWIWVQVTI